MKKIISLSLITFFWSCGKIELSPDFGNFGCFGCGMSYNSISIVNNNFSPDTLTVKKGTIVTWSNFNNDTHKVIATINSNLIGTLVPYGEFKFTAQVIGALKYHCSYHNERGTLIVIP